MAPRPGPDLAVACLYAKDVEVLLGNGNGTFQAAKPSGIGSARSIGAGDFDRDGKTDVVVGYQGFNDNHVVILRGGGDGTLQTGASYAVGNTPVDITIADLNGDGKLDVAVAIYDMYQAAVFLGNGDGTFTGPQTYKADNPNAIAAADMNSGGMLGAATNFPLNNAVFPAAITSADFNRDGKPDLAIADGGMANRVFVLLNTSQ